MSTLEIANKLIDLCRQGRHAECLATMYADHAVSVEAMAMPGTGRESNGLAAIKGKSEWWVSSHEIHSGSTEGPYVNGNQFMLHFDMDVTEKASGKRTQMREIGLYTVKDGKVVQEVFFYGS